VSYHHPDNLYNSNMMGDGQFLRNLWYFAVEGGKLRKGQLRTKELLGEKIVFGRNQDGRPFALRDNCPHRGVPLSEGTFDGQTIRCCYHGWEFDCTGVCQRIPALADRSLDLKRIKIGSYPCKEINGAIWVYMPDVRYPNADPEGSLPDLLIPADKRLLHVDMVRIPAGIDEAVVGLIDPAHVTFVHQSWFWRTAKSAKLKQKQFEPVGLGFKMVRHKPSANSRGYSLFKGETSTEITFQLPGQRLEHIRIGPTGTMVSLTLLTPINERLTELNHFFYSSLNFTKYISWPLRKLGKIFIGQDLHVFEKLSKGLQNEPKLMLLGDPDAQARWYFDLKKRWQLCLEQKTEFSNPLKPQVLSWVT
jgi:phenylpropionate dioxygenase-like ring-hydroxylating dioxygenase large terminal subunit